ncbi:MAG TPA: cell division protein SepF, partial [Bacillota bacterium]
MAKGFMERILNFLGFEQEEVEIEEEAYEPAPPPQEAEPEKPRGRGRGAVVNLPAAKPIKVVVVEPKSFDEVENIAENLKNRRPIIVNLEEVDKELARRVIDFLSGTAFAIDGITQRISAGVFLFAPNSVDVTSMVRDRSVFGEAAAARDDEGFP